jgi:threonine aldolase
MVFIEPPLEQIEPLRRHLESRRIDIGEQSPRIRMVTHLDIDDDGIERSIDAIRSFYE